MKILLISGNNILKQGFEKVEYINVKVANDLKEQDNYEIIIISDEKINYNDLVCTIDNNDSKNYKGKSQKKIYYVLFGEYSELVLNNIEIMCKTKNIKIFKPSSTIQTIVNEVILDIMPGLVKKNNNVVTFYGADSKVGTTMIAQSVAEIVGGMTEIKIGLFFLNERPSIYYLKKNEICGLDNIKIKLLNNILSSEEIEEACIKMEGNLFVLPGVEYIPEIRQYHPNHISRLIKLASKNFDLIIIDAGSNIDSGLAIAALTSTSNRYLVTTQQEIVRKNYQRIESQVFTKLNLNEKDFMMVINKYINSSSIYSVKQVANLYNLMLATYIPNLDILGWQSEIDNKSLLHYRNETYNTQIYKLARLILEQVNIPYKKEKLLKTRKEGIIKKAISNIGGVI